MADWTLTLPIARYISSGTVGDADSFKFEWQWPDGSSPPLVDGDLREDSNNRYLRRMLFDFNGRFVLHITTTDTGSPFSDPGADLSSNWETQTAGPRLRVQVGNRRWDFPTAAIADTIEPYIVSFTGDDLVAYEAFVESMPATASIEEGTATFWDGAGTNPFVEADTTAPAFSSATTNTNGTAVVLTFDEELDTSHVPAATAFTFSPVKTISGVTVSGTTVTLAVGAAFSSSDTITVAYTQPAAARSTTRLQDAAGNEVATFAAQSVTNAITTAIERTIAMAYDNRSVSETVQYWSGTFAADMLSGSNTSRPVLMSVTDGFIEINAGLALGSPDEGDFPLASPFSIQRLTLRNSAGTEEIATWILASPGDPIEFSIDDALSNRLLSETGDLQFLFSAAADTTAPTVISRTVNRTSLVIICNEELDTSSVPAATVFTVMVAGSARGVSNVAISGSTITLTLASTVTQNQVVTVAYTAPSNNPVQDSAGNDLATFAAAAVTNNTPDITAPVVSSRAVNARTLTITCNEALDTTSTPAAGAFAVVAGGSTITVSTVVISGTTVTLTLAAAVNSVQTVTVAYTAPSNNPVQDSAGNDLATFSAAAVTNNTPLTVASRTVNAAALVITCSAALDTTSVPAAASFAVRVDGSSRGVSTVAISGTEVTLTLASAVSEQQVVTVAYTKPNTNPIQDTGGKDLATFAAASVTNNTPDLTAPTVVSRTVNARTLTIACSETLDGNSRPATSAFSVMVAGSARSVSAVTVFGANITLTLASAVTSGQVVTVAYTTPTTNPVQDEAGNDLASFSVAAVTNRTPLTVVSRTVNAASLVITCSTTLDTNSVPAATAFAVSVNGSNRTVSVVNVSGAAITLTLSSAAVHGQIVTVAYTAPTNNPIRDSSGNNLATFSATSVANNTPDVAPPIVISRVVNAAALTIRCNENLDTGSVPATTAFGVRVDNTVRSISNVSISNRSVVLTLASAVENGQTVTVAYTAPNTNPVQDTAGNDLATFAAASVTNQTADTVPPTVTGRTVNRASLIINCSELLDTNSTPAASAFTVVVDGAVETILSVSISGTNVLISLANAVVEGEVVTVAYTVPNTNPVQDAAGNDLAAFSAAMVENNTLSPPPPPPNKPDIPLLPLRSRPSTFNERSDPFLSFLVVFQEYMTDSAGYVERNAIDTEQSVEADALVDLLLETVRGKALLIDRSGEHLTFGDPNQVQIANESEARGLVNNNRALTPLRAKQVFEETSNDVSWERISTTTLSGNLSVDLDQFDSDSFAGYQVRFRNVVPATDNVSFTIACSDDGGVSNTNMRGSSGSWSTSDLTLAQNIGNSTDETGFSGTLTISNLHNVAGSIFYLEGVKVSQDGTVGNVSQYGMLQRQSTDDEIDNISFQMSSGGMSSGQIDLHGYRADVREFDFRGLVDATAAQSASITNLTTVPQRAGRTVNLSITKGTGIYDTVSVVWSVVTSNGGSIVEDSNIETRARYTAPIRTTNLTVQIRAVATYRGSGLTAQTGSSVTRTYNETFTVTGLINAVAPSVTINTIPTGGENTTVRLGATLSGGSYDGDVEYAWTASGGTLTGADTATPTWRRPSVSSSTNYDIDLTITVRGTGTNAQDGTNASRSATTRTATVTNVLPVAAAAQSGSITDISTIAQEASRTVNLSLTKGTGIYDSVDVVWSVVTESGGSITEDNNIETRAVYTAPTRTSNLSVTIRAVATFRGTGNTARNGTTATATYNETFTVEGLPSATAGTVAISNKATSIARGGSRTFNLTVTKGSAIYDDVAIVWSITSPSSGGGTLTAAADGLSAVYRAPSPQSNRSVTIQAVATFSGDDTTARSGTSATDSDSDSFTVAGLPVADAPSVSINSVATGDQGTTVDLSATISGGRYDGAVEYAWTVGGGTLDDATSATPTWTRPDTTSDTDYNINLTVTVRGTGTRARTDTNDTASAAQVQATVKGGNKQTIQLPSSRRVISHTAPADEADEATWGWDSSNSAQLINNSLRGNSNRYFWYVKIVRGKIAQRTTFNMYLTDTIPTPAIPFGTDAAGDDLSDAFETSGSVELILDSSHRVFIQISNTNQNDPYSLNTPDLTSSMAIGIAGILDEMGVGATDTATIILRDYVP